jgi:thiol-disulfide isomerase/thioredoxin
MIRKTFRLLLGLFLLGVLFTPVKAQENKVNLYLFWSKTCPHCKDEISFINGIKPEYPNLTVYDFEITTRKNALILKKIGQELEVDIASVPITFVGNDHFAGYLSDETSGKQLVYLIEEYTKKGDPDVVGEIINSDKGLSPTPSPEENESKSKLPEEVKIPLVGAVKIKNLSLPVLTFVIALLDGFNPCAMWVLVFLISLLLGMRDRLKMWTLGTVFILASGFVYFLFLSAWLNLVMFLGFVTWVRVLIGLVALSMGVYQLNDYVKNKNAACKVTGGKKRKKVFDRLKEITQRKEFLLALGGIVVLAFAVNLVELVCSAGLPAIYTQVLSLTPMPKWQYYIYLLFYIIIFMIDDMAVFVVAMVTLNAVGVNNKYARLSRLIGGTLILILGLLMLFKPELLTFGL